MEAVAATRFYWDVPVEGVITFVDPEKTRHKRDPGRCFRRAGFHVSGKHALCSCVGKPGATQGGLIALHLGGAQFPEPSQPLGAQANLLGLG